jgi:hypothetical protein
MRRYFPAPTPRFGRRDAPLPVGHQQRSPYYWWWQYLRRNADYLACCEQGGTGPLASIYRDFGDVRPDDFKGWWNTGDRGVYLFAERPLAVAFGELQSPAEWGATWDPAAVMVIAVPLEMSKRKLKGSFAKLLDQRHTGRKAGRTSLAKVKQSSTARYCLERNYTIANLQTTLAVYDLWVANQALPTDQRAPLWEIGAKLKINREAIKDATSEHHADRLVGRNILAATVSRYLRQAKALIANTAQGRFPLA